MNGRMMILGLGLMLAAFAPVRAQRGNPAAGGAVTVKPVKGGLYQADGSVGNSFFFVGADEVLLVDAKMTPDGARQMLAEIRKVTDKPVRRVLLTHSDGDHVGGLAALPAGLTIVSHDVARREMAQANAAAATKLPLPNLTFSKTLSLYLGETEFRLLYFGPAHTSGDMAIYIPSLKTVIAGDLVFVGRDPLIHTEKGGNSAGLVAALKALAGLDAETYLSGHADAVDKKAVTDLAARIERKQARIKALASEGKSLDDVKKALGEDSAPAGRWPSLTEVIYREVSVKK